MTDWVVLLRYLGLMAIATGAAMPEVKFPTAVPALLNSETLLLPALVTHRFPAASIATAFGELKPPVR